MDDTTEAGLFPAYISVRGFWERLASRQVVRLRRDFEQGYRGVVLWGESVLPDNRRFELTRQELLDYEYDADLGFSLGVSGRLSQALAWVIGAPPMEEDTIPNRDQLHFARRLLRGGPESWPPESRSAAQRIIWRVADRKVRATEAIAELGAATPPTHRNTAALCRPLLPAVAEGRLGRYEALGFLANPAAPEQVSLAYLREVLLASLGEADLPLAAAILPLGELLPSPSDYEVYTATGRVSSLHAERELLLKAFALLTTDTGAAQALRSVIDNEAREDAVTVKIAIWALGRQNEKAAIDYLISLLPQSQYRYYLADIEEALSFLCSGAELVPAADGDEAPHWAEVRRSLPSDAEAWWLRDAESVHWEKRLRCAQGLDQHPEAGVLADRLRNDEVPNVRAAAGGIA